MPSFLPVKRALLVAGVLLAVAASQAQAVTVAGPPALVTDYANALQWWGQTPGCASVALREEGLAPGRAGEALIYSDGSCAIIVVPGQPACALPELVEHEVGHLLGYQHDADPRSIMYGEPREWPGCQRPAIEADLAVYSRWLTHEVRRCKRVTRPSCWNQVRLLRGEVRLRRRQLAEVPLLRRPG